MHQMGKDREAREANDLAVWRAKRRRAEAIEAEQIRRANGDPSL